MGSSAGKCTSCAPIASISSRMIASILRSTRQPERQVGVAAGRRPGGCSRRARAAGGSAPPRRPGPRAGCGGTGSTSAAARASDRRGVEAPRITRRTPGGRPGFTRTRSAVRGRLDPESSAYCPPAPSAPRGVPTSTTRAPSSTTIRSAMRTVEKRCDTSTVIRPLVAVLASRRGEALEQRVLGLGVERGGRLVEHEQQRLVAHEAAGERELLPLAEATPRRRRPTSARAGCRGRPAAAR